MRTDFAIEAIEVEGEGPLMFNNSTYLPHACRGDRGPTPGSHKGMVPWHLKLAQTL